jgi:hypothetical protein
MRKFLIRFILFFTPLYVIGLFVLIIDPYNYFFKGNFIPDAVKFQVVNRSAESMPRGNTLWKSIDFERHPSSNILIGDSRAYSMNVDTIKKISDLDFYNFGVPGGNYKSIIETFWYVTSIVRPERVYLQVAFHNYSATSSYNLMADAQKVRNRGFLFFSRFYFFKESLLDVYYTLRGKSTDQGGDQKFNAQNWNNILENQGKSSLVSMKYPANYYQDLQKISTYCKDNGIELVFIIFPDHQDFHNLITDLSLEAAYQQYKKDIYSLGKVYDYDYPNSALMKDRSNYVDIFHLKRSLTNRYIIRDIWGNKRCLSSMK